MGQGQLCSRYGQEINFSENLLQIIASTGSMLVIVKLRKIIMSCIRELESETILLKCYNNNDDKGY